MPNFVKSRLNWTGTGRHIPPILLLLLLALIFTYGHRSGRYPEFPGNPFLDAPKMFFPLRDWSFRQVCAGEIPLWNPLILCGMPNVAEIQSALFYPPNLLFCFLSTSEAMCACVALHLFMAGAFAYLLAFYYGAGRAGGLVSGISYMLCAPQVTHIFAGHLTMLCGIAWAPLTILLFDRALRGRCFLTGLAGGLVLGLQLLSGYPQVVLYSIHTVCLLGLCLTAWKFRSERCWMTAAGRLGILAVSIVFGFVLAGIQLLPAWEFVPYSVRGEMSFDWPGTYSLPPENLVTFLIPEFFGDEVYWGREYLWEASGYTGAVTLILAALAVAMSQRRVKWFFAAVTFLASLLALSKFTPVYYLAYYLLPGFSLFRGHAKYLVVVSLAISILGGIGLDSVLRLENENLRRLAARLTVFSIGVAIVISLLFIVYPAQSNVPAIWKALVVKTGAIPRFAVDQAAGITWDRMLRSAGRVILLIGAWAIGLRLLSASKGKRWLAALSVLIVLIDLSLTSWKFLMVAPKPQPAHGNVVEWDRKRSNRFQYRVVNPSSGPVNIGMVFGYPSSEGYVGNLPSTYSEFFRVVEGEPPDKVDFTFRRTGQSELSVLFCERGRSSKPLSRAFLIRQSNNAPLETLMRPPVTDPVAGKLPARSSVWPLAIRKLSEKDALYVPRKTEHGNQYVLAEFGEATGGYHVLADSSYPGWACFVNGQSRKHHRTYFTFRGLSLPAGVQRVEWIYDPLSFRLGVFLSFLAGSALVFCMSAHLLKRFTET